MGKIKLNTVPISENKELMMNLEHNPENFYRKPDEADDEFRDRILNGRDIKELEIAVYKYKDENGRMPGKIKIKNEYFSLLSAQSKSNEISFMKEAYQTIFGISFETGCFENDYEFVFEEKVDGAEFKNKIKEQI
jgi:hypothetical protein